MTNKDIDSFFLDMGLRDSLEKVVRPPNEMWMFKAGRFQLIIQTQDAANRMRIVAYIVEAISLDEGELWKLMEANYHTALDARYALTDEYLVSTFIHPLEELTAMQFVLGLFQVINCAETYGTLYSGGTMVFGISKGSSGATKAEGEINEIMTSLVRKIKQ